MLALPDVTLICADTLNPALAARALARSCERIRYGRALWLTDRSDRPAGLPDAVEIRRIDTLATRDDYSRLMLKGLGAPVELASRFSFEVAYPIGKPFGFHGLFNFCRVMGDDEMASLAPTFPDAVARSPQLLSLMRNCAAMGQWRAARAIAERILAADP